MADNQHQTTLRPATAARGPGVGKGRRFAVGAGYGALATVAMSVLMLAGVAHRLRLWQAIGYAVSLWVLMGLVWLPYLGGGLFGIR